MRLVPVYLGFSYRAIRELDGGEAFHFPPVAATKKFCEDVKIADSMADGDSLCTAYVTEKFEPHFANATT